MSTSVESEPLESNALELSAVNAGYGSLEVLHGLSLRVGAGEFVGLFGANGAGKSTTVRTACGLIRPTTGTVTIAGHDITRSRPESRVRQGMAVVPEGRRIFQDLTVEENLLMGAFSARSATSRGRLEREYERFPLLSGRRAEAAGTLSGGQQQALAVARALMSDPQVLILDEPSVGVAPIVVAEIFQTLRGLADQGVAVLMVEQNVAAALDVADRGYVVERGGIVTHGTAVELAADPAVQAAYLGTGLEADDHAHTENSEIR